MPEDLTIAIDLPCYACQYNLRGLAVEGRCPECGVVILPSLRQSGALPSPGHDHIRRYLRVKYYAKTAEVAGCCVDAVMFVNDAFQTTKSLLERARSAPLGPMDHMTARQVCDGFRAHARSYFNDEAEARELLNEWGIRSSEDVGRIIFAMVESGRLRAGEGDSPAAFVGLFTLEDLFAERDLSGFTKQSAKGERNASSVEDGKSSRLSDYVGAVLSIVACLFFAIVWFAVLHNLARLSLWIEIVVSLLLGGGLFYCFAVCTRTNGFDGPIEPVDREKGEPKA